MRLIDADKLEKQIAKMNIKDVMRNTNSERKAAFEWTKHDIYKMVKESPTVESR